VAPSSGSTSAGRWRSFENFAQDRSEKLGTARNGEVLNASRWKSNRLLRRSGGEVILLENLRFHTRRGKVKLEDGTKKPQPGPSRLSRASLSKLGDVYGTMPSAPAHRTHPRGGVIFIKAAGSSCRRTTGLPSSSRASRRRLERKFFRSDAIRPAEVAGQNDGATFSRMYWMVGVPRRCGRCGDFTVFLSAGR